MDAITNLQDLNWFEIFIGFIMVILAFQFLYKTIIEGIIQKFGWETKKMRQAREDRELLVKTSQNLAALQEKHDKDESHLEECLSNFIEETRKENNELCSDMRKYTENRVHDREQSLEIQKDLTNSIKTIVDSQKDRDEQINALMCGTKELLGNTIDELYEKYINLHGIPQNEVDEFDSIYSAYKGLNGNHGRETKYLYVKEHLQVIPVKTELIMNDN